MTMSIRRMTLGAGYRYLMSSVARADEATKVAGLTGYYAATGTPPGWFLGAGLAGLAGGVGVERWLAGHRGAAVEDARDAAGPGHR